MKTYIGCGGLGLNIHASKAQTFRYFSTDLLSIWTRYAETADVKELKVLYCNPLSNLSVRKLMM